ncbi:hypothetical protein DW322_02095 [Rhodococcus rhodnii]|uniref:DUF4232 domain-containing protein n=2 Tax=Rhodococcus rhodnii TaxID=38312 RepID=R7WJ07_9NOCA|nr:hypothetical protein [Rhodococcus rhodnii]EOM75236.1 hypothetical protein Rrhod_3457 [Rhodococcus rhodnii LMG 5362]TXG89256.1 hypothetical protein DW322_02095 [Rhodococcus rhodnii]
MLEPRGPLPPEIYWRRRVVAIAAAVVTLLLVVWGIAALGGGSDSEATAETAETTALPTATSTTATPSGSQTSGSGGSGTGGGGGSGASGSASGTSSDRESDEDSDDETSSEPVPPGQCPDQSLAIKATPDKPIYGPGEEPSFTTAVTNIGTSVCERDLGSGLQQVLVYTLDGKQRLWSNIDCFPQSDADIRELKPGEQAVFTVKWSAKTSTPECAEEPQPQRDPVGAGDFTVVGQLGELRSAPEPFRMNA